MYRVESNVGLPYAPSISFKACVKNYILKYQKCVLTAVTGGSCGLPGLSYEKIVVNL